MTAAQRIFKATDDLERILDEYTDDGDWYACLRNAIPYLKEALRSSPPGLGREPDEAFRKQSA